MRRSHAFRTARGRAKLTASTTGRNRNRNTGETKTIGRSPPNSQAECAERYRGEDRGGARCTAKVASAECASLLETRQIHSRSEGRRKGEVRSGCVQGIWRSSGGEIKR